MLGMHRSGTSVVAGAFCAVGYYAGEDTELMPGDRWNPQGYFENTTVVALNDELLAALGARWALPPVPADLEGVLPDLRRRCSAALDRLVGCAGARPVVLKDPRMGLLMPAWNGACGPDMVDVLVLRHPLAVARSLAERDGLTIPTALALWEVYLVSILRNLDGRPVAVLAFDGTGCGTPDPTGLDRFFTSRGLRAPNLAVHSAADVHFGADDEEFAHYATVDQQRLWEVLSALVGVHDEFLAPRAASRYPGESHDLVRQSARQTGNTAREVAWLRQEHEQLQRSIEAVLHSTSWRVTLPLRWLFGMRRRSEVDTTSRRYWSRRASVPGAQVHSGALPVEWAARGAGDTTVCAVVHAYYPDLLSEIVERLLICGRLTDVVVTHPLHVAESELSGPLAALRAAGITVRVVRTENRGRDVWPFLQVLDIMLATECHAFVKVHTKKTLHAAEGYGEQWRRELLEGLLPDRESVESIVTFIANAPVPGFVAPVPRVVRATGRDRSRRHLRRLRKQGGLRRHFPTLFPAGTMYWCARNWLEFLRALDLQREDFEPEPLAVDGTMAHAVERLIGNFCADRRAHIWQTRFAQDN